jgi:hypothetical protein
MHIRTVTAIIMMSNPLPIAASPAVIEVPPILKSSLSYQGPSGTTSPSQLVLTSLSFLLISLKSSVEYV